MQIRNFVLPMSTALLAACSYAPVQQTTVIATAPDYTPAILAFCIICILAAAALGLAFLLNRIEPASTYTLTSQLGFVQAQQLLSPVVTDIVLEAPRCGHLHEQADVVWAVANQRNCSPANAAMAIQRGLVRVTYMQQAALPPAGGAQ